MINLQDDIGNSALFKKYEVNEVLFTEFKCPLEEEKSSIWCYYNFFAFVVAGETLLQTPPLERICNVIVAPQNQCLRPLMELN